MVWLLSLGKSDFETIEPFRDDRLFKEALKEALGLVNVPGCANTDSGNNLNQAAVAVLN
ncbi:MAG: hypothetical protein WA129_04220 [Acidovorax sp.]